MFSPFNDTSGSYVITWTPPSSDNGSYYQILYYSFSSAYTIGPLYNGSSSIMLEQGQGSYNVPNSLYFTNYTIAITTVNRKYSINNGPVEMMDQTPNAGICSVSTKISSNFTLNHLRYTHPAHHTFHVASEQHTLANVSS